MKKFFFVLMAMIIVGVNAYSQTNVNVYSAGYYKDGNKNIACYWKNGIRQNLDLQGINGNSSANAITVSGNSVYIAGRYRDSSDKDIVCYWKDGVRQSLDSQGAYFAYPRTIVVSGNSVYVGGNGIFSDDLSVRRGINYYWKDGILQSYSHGRPGDSSASSTVYAIAVSDNSVYLVGTYSYGRGYSMTDVPCYWKDGVLQKSSFNVQGIYNRATAIVVSNNSIYIAGRLYINEKSFPFYWKDGVLQKFDQEGYVRAIIVSGDSVYLAGSSGSWDSACYWKDSVRQTLNLTGITSRSFATAISLFGDSIYIAGYYKNGDNWFVCYWKDGVRYDLGSIDGSLEEFNSSSTTIVLE